MRVTSNGKVWRSKAEWQALCERFAKSGLGQQDFCQREAIPVGSFKKWYQRCTVRPSQSEAFVELVAPPVRSEGWAAEIEFPSGIRLRVRG
jgi:hypothetical protein